MPQKADFRIIVIDDSPAIHRDFIKILMKSAVCELDAMDQIIFEENKPAALLPEFEIDTASQGEEGVKCVEKAIEEGRPYALAFVDIRMPPGWDGIETINRILKTDKDIQIVICTAYSDYSWEDTVERLGKMDNLLILKKPFDNVAVRQLACALTCKWQLLQDARAYTSHLKEKVEERTISLQQSLSLVKATLESSNDGILVISIDGKMIDYNQKLVQLWEIPQSVLNSQAEKEIVDHLKSLIKYPVEFDHKLKQVHSNNDMICIETIKFKDERIFECYSQPQKVGDKTVGRVWCFRDITKRYQLEKELQHMATHDALTGLANRVLLLEQIQKAITSANRQRNKFALLFVDLDRFKLINDSLSHSGGDQLLQSVANRLQSIVRAEDTLARLGGDEFVLVATNISSNEDVVVVANKLLACFQEPFNIAHRKVSITASIGIGIYPNDGDSVDMLLRNADSAMYSAKDHGSNNIQHYTAELNARSLEQLDQEMQLRLAIQNKELFLCYQPQINVATNKLVAVEALVRWQHPQKGTLLPIDFIPLAEERGLIVSIGEWVLRQACLQNKAWQIAGFAPIRMAVNVTAQQLQQQNMIETVANILKETHLSPQFLELELTENVIVSHLDIIKTVSELKNMGISIALDDFGTGYSSLSYLKKIPLDRLKIDASFIQSICMSTNDEAIIRAIIAMAHSFDLEVLAEGVETTDQLNFLKAENCWEAQGFYFSEPLMTTQMEEFLRNATMTNSTIF
ncbi:MAG: EAL domain-containing protein [Gammaproteobacteria bacterium]|nr:EAL domain-containing protein [Gammaproteobacteria bacterium]